MTARPDARRRLRGLRRASPHDAVSSGAIASTSSGSETPARRAPTRAASRPLNANPASPLLSRPSAARGPGGAGSGAEARRGRGRAGRRPRRRRAGWRTPGTGPRAAGRRRRSAGPRPRRPARRPGPGPRSFPGRRRPRRCTTRPRPPAAPRPRSNRRCSRAKTRSGTSLAQSAQMLRDRTRLRRRALHGHDAGHMAQAAQERGAEREMRGRRVVVDAERQAAGTRDRREVLEHLVVVQRRVGDGGKQARRGARGLRVPRQPDRVVRPQRADAHQDRHAPCRFLQGGLKRAAALGAGEIGVRAGAAEQADGVDARGAERGDKPAQGGHIDPAARVGWRDGEGGKPFQEHRDRPFLPPAVAGPTHDRDQRRIRTTPPIRRATPSKRGQSTERWARPIQPKWSNATEASI